MGLLGNMSMGACTYWVRNWETIKQTIDLGLNSTISPLLGVAAWKTQ